MTWILRLLAPVCLFAVFTVICLAQGVAFGDITSRWFTWGFSGEGIYAGFNALFSVVITALLFWVACALIGRVMSKTPDVKSRKSNREIILASLWLVLAIAASSLHAGQGFPPEMSDWVAIACFLFLSFGIAEVGVAMHRSCSKCDRDA